MVVVGCLLLQVSGVWWGTKDDFAEANTLEETHSEDRASGSQKAQVADIKNS